VHIGQAVMTLQSTVETLIGMVFSYPTLSELYEYAAYDALEHGPMRLRSASVRERQSEPHPT